MLIWTEPLVRAVSAVEPLGARATLPVPAAPRVSVWPFVVLRIPVAVNESALLLAPEIEAVGVPAPTLRKPNFAELVALDPSKRSSLVFLSNMALLLSSANGEPPLIVGKMPVTSLVRLIRLLVKVPFAEL